MKKTIREGSMSDIDVMAKEAASFKDFVKEFYKEFRDFPKNREAMKWLEDTYKSVSEGTESDDLERVADGLPQTVEETINEIALSSAGVRDFLRALYRNNNIVKKLGFANFKGVVDYIRGSGGRDWDELRDEATAFGLQFESVNEDHSGDPNDKYVVRPCKHPIEKWAVWEGEVRVKGFETKPEADAFADAKNKEQGITEVDDTIDTITMDVPLFIRTLEFAREDAKTDMDLHDFSQRAIKLTKEKGTIDMSSYNELIGGSSVNESMNPSDIVKDLDKVKNDLLKKVDVLIVKKKKLYSNVDIESPMSADEKKLNKDIADLFSQINTLVLQKRSLKSESVNEGAGCGCGCGCGGSTLKENTEPSIISQLKDIVKHNQSKVLVDPKSGKKMRVDLFSASAITQVYDALKQQSNRDKFVGSGLIGMQSMAMKLLK
jgi:hypothetical protein